MTTPRNTQSKEQHTCYSYSLIAISWLLSSVFSEALPKIGRNALLHNTAKEAR